MAPIKIKTLATMWAARSRTGWRIKFASIKIILRFHADRPQRIKYIAPAARISFSMFLDEIRNKLGACGEILPFTLAMLSRDKLVISGIKSVLSVEEGLVRLRLAGAKVAVSGKDLTIAEIGGGDVYIKGRIGGVNFEES